MSSISTSIDNLLNAGNEAKYLGCYLACFNEGTSILAEASKRSNLSTVKWFGTSAYALNSTLTANQTAAEFAIKTNFVCPVYGLDENSKSKWEPVFNELKSTLNRDPESYALVAYDAFNVAFSASLLLKNNSSIKSLKEAVINITKDTSGITGNLELDSYGDRLNGNYIFWKVRKSGLRYEWYKFAVYHTDTDILEYY